MCRLFSRADSYVADPHVVSGSLKKITAQKTIYRFDDFDEKPGYTMSVVDGIFGDEKLKEEMERIMQRNIEVQNENRSLKEECEELEGQVVEAKMVAAQVSLALRSPPHS